MLILKEVFMRKLLFFYAPWCSPCRYFEQEFIIPLSERVGKEKIEKINVQENPFLADKYGVTRLPCAMMIEDGRLSDFVSFPDTEKCVMFLAGGEALD